MQKDGLVERLDDDVVRAGFVSRTDGVLFAQPGRQQDGNVEITRIGANGAAKIEAAHIRHDDIGDDKGRRLTLEQRKRCGTVLGFDRIETAALEEGARQNAVDRIVVDHQDGRPAMGSEMNGRRGFGGHRRLKED
jgi:hypothetical protein